MSIKAEIKINPDLEFVTNRASMPINANKRNKKNGFITFVFKILKENI